MEHPFHTIILTDDDEDDRDFFTSAVQSLYPHINVVTFNDGVGLKTFLIDQLGEKPQLIFLDINMPRMDGFQVLALIRELYPPDDLPIIMYTTSGSEDDIERARRLGANLYMRKPNDYKILKKNVNEVLSIDWSKRQVNGDNFLL